MIGLLLQRIGRGLAQVGAARIASRRRTGRAILAFVSILPDSAPAELQTERAEFRTDPS